VTASEAGNSRNNFFKGRMLSSFSNRNYRLYFFGTLGQFAAMNMQMVTGPLLIYRLTDSSALLGIMSLVSAFPMIIMSLFGGAISDKVQKKYILIISLLCFCLVSLAIALFLETGIISKEAAGSWKILMVCSFLQGIFTGFLMPSIQAILPELVEKEQVMNAIALNMLGMNIVSFLASAAAGVMIDAFNFQSVYYALTGIYIYVAACILFIPPTGKLTKRGMGILSDIQQGLNYVRNHFTILFILLFSMVVVVLTMPYQQLLPIFVDDILKVGATGMGVMMGVSGIGAMVGSFFLTALPNKKRGLILLIVGLVSGLSLAGFAVSSSWFLSLAFMFFVGLANAVRNTIGSALLQVYTERDYMGRVMSLFNVQFGVASICTFLAGVLAERIAVQWVVGGLAGMLIVFAAFSLIFSAKIRELD
jgi:MFS transporter, DHA1 family, staphyloferrin A biosynthesis exporter